MKKLIWSVFVVLIFGCQPKPNSSMEYTSKWQFRQLGDTTWLPAQVPGVVQLDLLKNGIIDDPYRNNNELELSWIEDENWEYHSTWNVDKELLSNDHIELTFQGLDTYAEISLNDSLILSTDNMFRTWSFDAKPVLIQGENIISILFTSPLIKNKEKVENHPYELPSGNETVDLKVGSYTRKAAYHFGWDWGPRFVTSGIWRPVTITSWNDVRITDVYCTTLNIDTDHATIETALTIESEIEGERMISLNDRKEQVELAIGLNEFKYQTRIDNPKLWWPNGYGEPNLHEMNVQLSKNSSIIEEKTVTYGIRTIELINEPDSIGTSYYFKINGESIFARGANYIPQDLFLPRVTKEKYQQLISSTKNANMNMLRVWGGGIYENDLFYDLCDKNGIMVWQDLMFAGSMYPTDDAFHTTVIQEIKDNVKRLRSHPSIALWCGNNEIEIAWENWAWPWHFKYSDADSAEVWRNYVSLFQEKIPKTIQDLTPNIAYVSTSPLSNWGTENNFNHGSMHYWGVWHGREPFENFKKNVPRFMAEYGFQSFPSYDLLSSVIDSSSMSVNSEVMENRQKSYIGNEMITLFSEKYFGPAGDFSTYIENSQKTQAQAYKEAIQAHRLGKPHCMGTMFWQLNDCWQGPSWSVLDYEGNPKLAYEEVKKWYQPIVVIPQITKDEAIFIVVSDSKQKFNGYLGIGFWDEGGMLVDDLQFDISLDGNEIKEISLSDMIEPWYYSYSLDLHEYNSTDESLIFEDFGSMKKPGLEPPL